MDKFYLSELPKDPCSATKHLLDKILNDIHPQVIRTRKILDGWAESEEDTTNIDNVYTLCLSQINKCLLHLFEVFRLEYNNHTFLQESRHCTLERLSWCLNRLASLEQYLERKTQGDCNDDEQSDGFNVPMMSFVNWIDSVFEILNKLSELIYKTDCKEDEGLYEQWKSDVAWCTESARACVRELLVSAVSLARAARAGDQRAVTARAHVVLRETKTLVTELFGDNDIAAGSLVLPLHASNAVVLVRVVHNALHALEAAANAALLTLLIHCSSRPASPLHHLTEHFLAAKHGVCACEGVGACGGAGDVLEQCEQVKAFDTYNDQLLQIGSFAASCSSDHNSVLQVRSALATLEALEAWLVPALAASPRSPHARLLAAAWEEEVQALRDNVFLIVDPAAFTQRCQQMTRESLVAALRSGECGGAGGAARDVTGAGGALVALLRLYAARAPAALTRPDHLMPILDQLHRATRECEVVWNHLSSESDHKYDVKNTSHRPTLADLHKRLKLVYTLVTRIHKLLQPPECDLEEEEPIDDKTHTIARNPTYSKSPTKAAGRSMFVRTNIQSSTRNYPLSKLTEHLHGKNCSQLNFTAELDRLLDEDDHFDNIDLKNIDKQSVCYSAKNRSSMRKAALSRHVTCGQLDNMGTTIVLDSDRTVLLNDNDSLQLTAVLHHMRDMAGLVPGTRRRDTQHNTFTKHADNITSASLNINDPSINVNNESDIINNFSKMINNTSVNVNNMTVNVNNPSVNVNDTSKMINTTSEMINNTSEMINNRSEVVKQSVNVSIAATSELSASVRSAVGTLERVRDLHYVDNKLNSLRAQLETSL